MLPLKDKFIKFDWTYNDRNMSHFFMKAFTNFARFGYVNSQFCFSVGDRVLLFEDTLSKCELKNKDSKPDY